MNHYESVNQVVEDRKRDLLRLGTIEATRKEFLADSKRWILELEKLTGASWLRSIRIKLFSSKHRCAHLSVEHFLHLPGHEMNTKYDINKVKIPGIQPQNMYSVKFKNFGDGNSFTI